MKFMEIKYIHIYNKLIYELSLLNLLLFSGIKFPMANGIFITNNSCDLFIQNQKRNNISSTKEGENSFYKDIHKSYKEEL